LRDCGIELLRFGVGDYDTRNTNNIQNGSDFRNADNTRDADSTANPTTTPGGSTGTTSQ
jgi:hypothetical protein